MVARGHCDFDWGAQGRRNVYATASTWGQKIEPDAEPDLEDVVEPVEASA